MLADRLNLMENRRFRLMPRYPHSVNPYAERFLYYRRKFWHLAQDADYQKMLRYEKHLIRWNMLYFGAYAP
jgi:hypothetical protein